MTIRSAGCHSDENSDSVKKTDLAEEEEARRMRLAESEESETGGSHTSCGAVSESLVASTTTLARSCSSGQ